MAPVNTIAAFADMSFDLNFLIKLLTWVAAPLGLFTLGSLFALCLLVLRRAPHIRVLVLMLASLQLLFFSLPMVAAWLHHKLESQSLEMAVPHNRGNGYGAILLLGGTGFSLSAAEAKQLGQAEFGDGVDRILHAAELYHRGIAPRIIISGGNWDTVDPTRPSEAYSIRLLLNQLGVPSANILIEERSRTTRENFLFTDALLKQLQFKGPLALVTSASHMPRAMRNARTLNIQADAFPTDWRSPALRYQPLPWLPSATALEQSEVALKEWLAMLIDY